MVPVPNSANLVITFNMYPHYTSAKEKKWWQPVKVKLLPEVIWRDFDDLGRWPNMTKIIWSHLLVSYFVSRRAHCKDLMMDFHSMLTLERSLYYSGWWRARRVCLESKIQEQEEQLGAVLAAEGDLHHSHVR